MRGRDPEQRRRVGPGAVLGLLVIVAGAAWFVGAHTRSPEQAAASSQPPSRTLLTAPVADRVLENAVTLTGTVAERITATVTVPTHPVVSGVAVLTRPLPRVGSPVRSGQLLTEVAGDPVVVLAGTIPAYRDLLTGDSGPDVAQLQRALRSLGYGTGRTAVFDVQTRRGVARLFRSLGYELPEKSTADLTGGPPHTEQYLARSMLVYASSLPATVATAGGDIGTDPEAARVQLSNGPPHLEVAAPADGSLVLQDLVGKQVTWQLDGTDGQGTGRVARILPAKGQAPPRLLVATDQALGSSSVRSTVTVRVVVSRTNGPVTAVPIAAISTDSSGRPRVTTVSADGQRQLVDVTTGATAGGYVQVSGTGLTAGQQVVVSK